MLKAAYNWDFKKSVHKFKKGDTFTNFQKGVDILAQMGELKISNSSLQILLKNKYE